MQDLINHFILNIGFRAFMVHQVFRWHRCRYRCLTQEQLSDLANILGDMPDTAWHPTDRNRCRVSDLAKYRIGVQVTIYHTQSHLSAQPSAAVVNSLFTKSWNGFERRVHNMKGKSMASNSFGRTKTSSKKLWYTGCDLFMFTTCDVANIWQLTKHSIYNP